MRLTERKVCYPQCDKQGKLTKVDYIEIKDKKLAEEKLCQLEDIEELVNIPFAKISNLKVGDVVYFRMGKINKGEVSNINYGSLTITILDEKMTLTDFMLFHQYGKDRQSPSHCWMGAWALTKEELEK